MNKKIVLPLLAVIILSTIAFAAWNWNVSVVVNVSPSSCADSDGGADYLVKGNASALVVISNYYPINTNTTLPITAEDTCQGDILFEVVCGSAYGYDGLGGLLSLNCSDLNTNNETYACQAGACVNLNATLPPVNNSLPTGWMLYDDFSSGSLDLNKWTESPAPNLRFSTEHYVNSSTGRYRIAQTTAGSGGTLLSFNKTFLAGESISYELYYNFASNTTQHTFWINGQYSTQSGVVPNPTPNPGSGAIGYWNGLTDVGNATGKYIISEYFNSNNITQTIIRPDNSTIQHTYTAVLAPYTFGLITQAGHDGLINTDFDNVYIYSNTSISPLNNTNQSNSTLPLVALWHFDEGTGTTAADSSGNGNTGTLHGAIWTNDSILGNALHFNGVAQPNNEVFVGAPIVLDLFYNVSIEAWIKMSASGSGSIVNKNGPYQLSIHNNKIHGGVYHSDGAGGNIWTEIDGTTNLQVGTWYKLKMTYDGSNIKLYINDLLDTSFPISGPMPQTGQSLLIGWGHWDNPGQDYPFNGTIDEVSIRGN